MNGSFLEWHAFFEIASRVDIVLMALADDKILAFGSVIALVLDIPGLIIFKLVKDP